MNATIRLSACALALVAFVAAPQSAAARTHIVYPTGDGTTDTDAVQAAIDAAADDDMILLKARNTAGAPTRFVIAKPWTEAGRCKVVAADGVTGYYEDVPRASGRPYQILSLANRRLTLAGEDDRGARTTITQFRNYEGFKSWRLSPAFRDGAGSGTLLVASGTPSARVTFKDLNFEFTAGIGLSCLFDMKGCTFTIDYAPQGGIDNLNSYGTSFDPANPDFSLPLARCSVKGCTLTDVVNGIQLLGSGITVKDCVIRGTPFRDTMAAEGVLNYPAGFLWDTSADFSHVFLAGAGDFKYFFFVRSNKYCVDSSIIGCDVTEESLLMTSTNGLMTAAFDGGYTQDSRISDCRATNLRSSGWAILNRCYRHGVRNFATNLGGEISDNVLTGCWQDIAQVTGTLNHRLEGGVITGNTFIDSTDGFGFGTGLGVSAYFALNTLISNNDYRRSTIPPISETNNPSMTCVYLEQCYDSTIDERSFPQHSRDVSDWITIVGGARNIIVNDDD